MTIRCSCQHGSSFRSASSRRKRSNILVAFLLLAAPRASHQQSILTSASCSLFLAAQSTAFHTHRQTGQCKRKSMLVSSFSSYQVKAKFGLVGRGTGSWNGMPSKRRDPPIGHQLVAADFLTREVFSVMSKSFTCFFLSSLLMFSPAYVVGDGMNVFHVPHANAASTLDPPSSETSPSPAQAIVDETWNLVSKYYIDRTYNNQDWDQIHRKYEEMARKTTSPDATNKLITSMVATLGDKYSRVLDPAAYSAIQKYDLIGVGVTLMPNENGEIIVGAPPIAGSASDKAHLQVGDKVIAVNGVSTKGRTSFDIVDQISEKANAETIQMTVIKKDAPSVSATPEDISMPRQFQQVQNPVKYKISERRGDGTVVGFVKVSEFNVLVKPKLQDALQSLQASGANAFVLDLRQNTGGAFQSAVEVSSLFVKDRVATYVVDNSNKELTFRTAKHEPMVDPSAPMVIWLDGRSASASEVLAGSLHDNCRAVTMGEQSFGKGLIQAVYGLKNGAGLVLTVAKYVTPSGMTIHGVGITPDIQGGVPMPIPGKVTDTSQIDFDEVKHRLDPGFCHVPSSSDSGEA